MGRRYQRWMSVLLACATSVPLMASAAAPTAAPAAAPAAPKGPSEYSASRTIAGTDVKITVWDRDSRRAGTALLASMEETSRILRKLNASNRNSEISLINRIADREEALVSRETFGLLELALKFCRSTGRSYDPTVQSFDYLWQFGRRPAVRPLADELRTRARFSRCEKIALKPGRKVRLLEQDMRVGLGELLHGHALDRVAALLRKMGIESFRLRVGRDAYISGHTGTRHWLLTVEHPFDPAQTMAQLYMSSHAAATRSQAETFFMRGGVRYHDVLNPKTGQPARGVVQATAISPDPLLADALSSALMVMGVAKGLRHLEALSNAEGFLIDEKGKVHATSGMKSLGRLPASIRL